MKITQFFFTLYDLVFDAVAQFARELFEIVAKATGFVAQFFGLPVAQFVDLRFEFGGPRFEFAHQAALGVEPIFFKGFVFFAALFVVVFRIL